MSNPNKPDFKLTWKRECCGRYVGVNESGESVGYVNRTGLNGSFNAYIKVVTPEDEVVPVDIKLIRTGLETVWEAKQEAEHALNL